MKRDPTISIEGSEKVEESSADPNKNDAPKRRRSSRDKNVRMSLPTSA